MTITNRLNDDRLRELIDVLKERKFLGHTAQRKADQDCASAVTELIEARAALVSLGAEQDKLREALKPFLGDAIMEKILWGDLPDESTGSVAMQLKHFRAARLALNTIEADHG